MDIVINDEVVGPMIWSWLKNRDGAANHLFPFNLLFF